LSAFYRDSLGREVEIGSVSNNTCAAPPSGPPHRRRVHTSAIYPEGMAEASSNIYSHFFRLKNKIIAVATAIITSQTNG
jgi:hypothetical protein